MGNRLFEDMAASRKSAKKKTPAKKATPAKKSKVAKRVETSSGSAWETAAMKVSGSRKRKASALVSSDEFHSGSLPAQGTKPLKRNRGSANKATAKKSEKKVKAVSVVSELKQILRIAQAALDKLN